ncbi:MAG: hypothetical protein ABI678_17355 [Kofleriaceae bacterium]
MNRIGLGVLLLAACGAAPTHAHTTTLVAPTGVASWTSVEVQTGVAEDHYHQSYVGGEGTIDLTRVTLVIRRGPNSQSVALVSDGSDVFGLTMPSRDWARVEFQLAASPDGAWLAVSADAGGSWVLVDPDGLVACKPAVHGPPVWASLPRPPRC